MATSTPTIGTRAVRAPAAARSARSAAIAGTALLHLILMLAALTMIVPFLWMISTSLKDFSQVFNVPPNWIPDPFVWSNYPNALTALPFGRAYWNSFYIAAVVVGSQLLTCSMAGYAFARINFPFRDAIFILFLATLMIPQHVTIIPLYLVMRQLGWLDTHLALIVPNALFSAFGVFLLRQFFVSLPRELEEAAVLDGASRFQIFIRIILPLSKAPLATLALLSFLTNWNDFLWPTYVLFSPKNLILPPGLQKLQGAYETDYAVVMAGAVLASIPVLILFLIAQRYIIEGVSRSGVKG